MFESIELSPSVSVPGILIGNTRIIFEPSDDLTPDDPQGFFAAPNGALIIDSTKPRIYAKWLKQIMSGISDSQRYKNLPMRRITGTDTHGSPYSVVAVGDPGSRTFQALADEWAGYFSGHAYNVRVQDYKAIGSSGIWTYRSPDLVTPFFGDPTSESRGPAAIVLSYNLVKEDDA